MISDSALVSSHVMVFKVKRVGKDIPAAKSGDAVSAVDAYRSSLTR
jgi:hypothetical protein